MAGVFLSYRRSDSGDWTRRLHERLALRFGESLVWRDVDDIPLGRNYLDEIRSGITAADAVVVVIGPQWLNKRRGRTRLSAPGDVLRREIAWALDAKRAVIPALVGGATMPSAAKLPASVAAFARQEAQLLRETQWDADCSALFEGLRIIVGKIRKPPPLRNLHQKLIDMQQRYFDLLDSDPVRALELARATLRLLDEQSPHFPQDSLLQNQRGYALKNEAMALRDLGQGKGFRASLGRARAVFDGMRVENEERTAEAYNGLGSVDALRGQYQESLRWIDRALALVPDYGAALSDRKQVMARMESDTTREKAPWR